MWNLSTAGIGNFCVVLISKITANIELKSIDLVHENTIPATGPVAIATARFQENFKRQC